MCETPSSLFRLTLNYIASNAAMIESLEDFPSEIGKQIFIQTVMQLEWKESSSIKIISTFVKAYQSQVLFSLNLERGLIFINEYLDPLLILTKHLIELDLSFCHLGDRHEFIEYICNLHCLKRLSLKKNCLSIRGIRKLTLPMRILNKGPGNLQELDLSDNNLLGDDIVRMISVFKNLILLNLSGTSITDAGIIVLKSKCSMVPCPLSEYNWLPIFSQGWAEVLLSKWHAILNSRKRPKIARCCFYLNKRLTENPLCPLKDFLLTIPDPSPSLIFKKLPLVKEARSLKTKQKANSVAPSMKDVEKELFAQYQ